MANENNNIGNANINEGAQGELNEKEAKRQFRSRSRVLAVKFDGDSTVAASDGLDGVPITILYTIVDRLAGVTDVESIWRKDVNHAFVSRNLRRKEARVEVAQFFQSLRTARIIPHLLAVRTLGAGEKMVLTHDIVQAVIDRADVQYAESHSVISELLNAYLMKVGLVPERNGNYCNLVQYYSGPVTPETLAADVLGQQISSAVSSVTVVDLEKGKYTPATFATEVALNLESIGKVLTDSHEMNTLVDDIVRGVRAHIEPSLTGMFGTVPASWRESDIVKEASRNYVFVRAALSLEQGSDVTPVNSEYRLDHYAPAVWTALKSSTRYHFASVTELKRTRGLKRVRDVHGVVRSCILWDSARPDAIAQAVHANPDARLTGAIRVTDESSRVADTIKAAYGNVTGMGTDAAIHGLSALLRHDVEASVKEDGDSYDGKSMYAFTVGDNSQVTLHELASLMSTRVFVNLNPEANVPSERDIASLLSKWTFVCDTKETRLPDMAGTILGGQFYTTNANALFMATEDFAPSATLSAIPQVIPARGIGASHIGLDVKERFRALNKRASYDIKFNDIHLNGAIRASALKVFATTDDVSIVRPMFNDDVFISVANIHAEMIELVDGSKKRGGEMYHRLMSNLYAQFAIELSEQVGVAMRLQVHAAVYVEAGKKLPANEARRLGLSLNDDAARAVINIISLITFLRIQGLEAADQLTTCLMSADILGAIAVNAPARKAN